MPQKNELNNLLDNWVVDFEKFYSYIEEIEKSEDDVIF